MQYNLMAVEPMERLGFRGDETAEVDGRVRQTEKKERKGFQGGMEQVSKLAEEPTTSPNLFHRIVFDAGLYKEISCCHVGRRRTRGLL